MTDDSLYPEECFPTAIRKLVELLHAFTHTRFVGLLGSYPVGHSLDRTSDMGTTLLGVGEVLATDDFELPILLNNIDDGDSIVVIRGPENGRIHACRLCRGYLRSEMKW